MQNKQQAMHVFKRQLEHSEKSAQTAMYAIRVKFMLSAFKPTL